MFGHNRDKVSCAALVGIKKRAAERDKHYAEFNAALDLYQKGKTVYLASIDTPTRCGWDENDSMEWRMRYAKLPNGEAEIAQGLLQLEKLSAEGYAPATNWLAAKKERQNNRYTIG